MKYLYKGQIVTADSKEEAIKILADLAKYSVTNTTTIEYEGDKFDVTHYCEYTNLSDEELKRSGWIKIQDKKGKKAEIQYLCNNRGIADKIYSHKGDEKLLEISKALLAMLSGPYYSGTYKKDIRNVLSHQVIKWKYGNKEGI